MQYLFFLLATCVLSILLTPVVRKLAFRINAIDVPRPPRNLHTHTVAKLGGLVVYLSFAIGVLLMVYLNLIDPLIIPFKFVWALLLGGAVLIIGGIIDDKYNLPPLPLFLFPAISALIIVLSGIGVGIKEISNPFGAPISLDFTVFGLVPFSGVFIFVWLLGMMFTTKFLDGLDGLVAGIGLIAGLTLFILSLTEQVNQPITANLAIVLVGALAGYLVFASHPASIFLGEGGSTIIGFILGVISVILGGKIATALLVMGIPILDVAWVILQRVWFGKSPFRGDRLHIHFRLLDLGFSQRQTALILYSISAVFGFTAVFLQSMGKFVAFGLSLGIMVILVSFLVVSYKKVNNHQNS